MDTLSIVVEAYRRYCELIPVAVPPTPASPEEIESRRVIIVGSQPVRLDESYLRLASEIDGPAAHGAQLYPLVSRVMKTKSGDVFDCMGVTEANQHWRDVYGEGKEVANWLVYGRDDTAFFVRNLKDGRYQHRSRRGLSVVYFDCETFEECVWEAFRYALDLGAFPR